MNSENVKVEIQCDDQAASELRSIFTPDARPRFVERRSITGDAATWVVIATFTANTLPHILEFIIKWRELSRVKKIKVGDIEIENPSGDDLEKLRSLMAPPIESSDES